MSIQSAVSNQVLTTTGTPTFTSVAPGNLLLSGNTIASSDANGRISLIPNAAGVVSIGSATLAGTSSTGLLQVIGGASVNSTVGAFTNGTTGPALNLIKSRNETPGSFTIVTTGDALGTIAWSADNGSSYALVSQIKTTAIGTVSAGVVPTNMVIATSTSAGTLTTAINIDSAQIVTKPLNPKFFATTTVTQTDVTGDNTTAKLICNNAVTNVGSSYSTSTGVFTAPVAGFYTFTASLSIAGLVYPTNTSIQAFWFVNSTIYNCYFSSVPATLTSNTIIFNATITVQLATNGTVELNAKVAGGTKVVDFDTNSWICGALLG